MAEKEIKVKRAGELAKDCIIIQEYIENTGDEIDDQFTDELIPQLQQLLKIYNFNTYKALNEKAETYMNEEQKKKYKENVVVIEETPMKPFERALSLLSLVVFSLSDAIKTDKIYTVFRTGAHLKCSLLVSDWLRSLNNNLPNASIKAFAKLDETIKLKETPALLGPNESNAKVIRNFTVVDKVIDGLRNLKPDEEDPIDYSTKEEAELEAIIKELCVRRWRLQILKVQIMKSRSFVQRTEAFFDKLIVFNDVEGKDIALLVAIIAFLDKEGVAEEKGFEEKTRELLKALDESRKSNVSVDATYKEIVSLHK